MRADRDPFACSAFDNVGVVSGSDRVVFWDFDGTLARLNRRNWTTRYQPRIAIVTWIERTYRRRRQHRLGRLTPVEFEAIMNTPAALAA